MHKSPHCEARLALATRGNRNRLDADEGSVSAEFAVLVPALVAFIVMLASVLAAAAAQVTVAAAAREAGRMVSRGEPAWAIEQSINLQTPTLDDVHVDLQQDDDGIWISVTGRPRGLVRAPSLFVPRVQSKLWVLSQ